VSADLSLDTDVVTVVGVGADGWAGLTIQAQSVLQQAEVIFGSERQLDLLPSELAAQRVPWPMPLLPRLAAALTAQEGCRRAVLGSGDPTFYGIATTIKRLAPQVQLTVIPHPSSLALACAQLGWPQQDVEVISLVGRPVAALAARAYPGRRLLLLAEGGHSAAPVCALLRDRGLGASIVTVLSNLGAEREQRIETTAADWPADGQTDPLTVLAVECRAAPNVSGPRLSLAPGLPDDAYEHDGQLTKRHVRAITLASLAPAPGELLWDVGGGAGSIGIEWMRSHSSCRAICIERDATRAKRIESNASSLGVPGLIVVLGSAPAALNELPSPDAIFIGGGITEPGLIEVCWTALGSGGRLVANLATLESEQVILGARTTYGGHLTRIDIAQETTVGRFTGWRPAMTVTQWAVTKR
jgi:precorrin-6Y C5,15-methyltransferase (decarboxylating)